jgi:O-antigen/teichoic acid export membrane protein
MRPLEQSVRRLLGVYTCLDPDKEGTLRLAAGLLDQAVVSAANFALNVVLARALTTTDYGAVSVVMSFLLVCNTVHQALVVYPLSVRVAAASVRRQDYLVSVGVILTPLLGLAMLPALRIFLGSSGASDAFLPVSFALVFWQMQEVVRRGFLARGATIAAIIVDMVRYIGAVLAIVAAISHLTIDRVFLIIAACSACGAIPLTLVPPRQVRIAGRTIGKEIAQHWRLAAPVLGANLLAAFSTQWFLWLLAWHGKSFDAAALVALAGIVSVSNPVMYGIENVLVPEIARVHQTLRFPDMLHLLWRRALVGAALIAPFFVLIAAFPTLTVQVVYGSGTAYASSPGAVRLLIGAYVFYFASYALGAVLRAYRAGPEIFQTQLYPALLGISIGSWLTWNDGLFGACLASLLAAMVRASLGLWFVSRLRHSVPTASAVLSAS